MKTLHTPLHGLILPIVLVAFAVIAAPAVHGQVVVQWGQSTNIVTNFVSVNLNTDVLNAATPRNPTIGGSSGYYDGGSPAGISAVFYGATFANTNTSPSATSRLQIPNNVTISSQTSDNLVFDFGTLTVSSHTVAGVAFWQKSDGFLNGFNTNTLAFSDINNLTLRTSVNAARAEQQLRVVIRDGADYYVSNHLGALSSGWTNFGLANISSWSNYNPTTDIVAIGSAATPVLGDVTGIGYLFTDVNSDLSTVNFRVSEFNVTAVPEPSTVALLLGGVCALAIAGRFKRRS
jgi:hypothetical protein